VDIRLEMKKHYSHRTTKYLSAYTYPRISANLSAVEYYYNKTALFFYTKNTQEPTAPFSPQFFLEITN